MADVIPTCFLHHPSLELALRGQLKQAQLHNRREEVEHDKAGKGSGLADKSTVPLHQAR